ncbi:diiron oxygenase [Streptomyces sp. MST-110588]|uniref:diiron oxygenase n=1 Tax=Streptomyces sp. MST-110588 TaxID=2833628 RepID=UPI001F5C62E2|nr:diiron oxygenase [Streptomyces sp. MST-110588]UNO39182.1 diiron oxygenase [Streptomyces sp. MST-110588]
MTVSPVKAADERPTEETGPAEPSVGPGVLKRLAASWPRRATIRTDMNRVSSPEAYDPELLDYPVHLLPFAEHPAFLAASEEKRRQVNTLAWIAYNERVIAAEEYVANPTFEKLAHGVFPGVDRYEVKEAVQQSHVDEVWHTYMHMIAMQRTREARAIGSEPDYVQPVTNRALYELAGQASEQWEKDLLYLLWTAVGEISINAFLDLLGDDRTIQPLHTLIARLHARDEAAHGPILAELMKEIYPRLNKRQQEFFIQHLPTAVTTFGAEDYELWPQILRFAGIPRVTEIIEDTRRQPGGDLMLTDFRTVHRLVQELEIEDRVDFDFRVLRAGGSR